MTKNKYLEDNVIDNIKKIATKYKIERIILFGSRARGDNSPVSDYDIAVYNPFITEIEKTSFYHDIDEIETLKKIDIVFINDETDTELIESINKDGVIIYDKLRNKT
jgi:predicted nucleotidyltransferase